MSRTTSLLLTFMNSVILPTVTSTQMEQNMLHLGNQMFPNQAPATGHATPQLVENSTPRRGAVGTHASSGMSVVLEKVPTLTTNAPPQTCSKWACLGGKGLNGA